MCLQVAIKAAEETLAAEQNFAQETLKAAGERAVAEHEALQKELEACQAAKIELEAKVVRAAASLKAADELKELRCAPSPNATNKRMRDNIHAKNLTNTSMILLEGPCTPSRRLCSFNLRS